MKRFSLIVTILILAFVWAQPVAVVSAMDRSGYEKKQNRQEPVEILKTNIVIDLTILGPPIATKEQCLKYLLRRNPLPLLTVTPKELVDYYYTESMQEGVRPDVAFAQALHETGNFNYGGDVVPLQNNYCGLGTVGGGVKGAWFSSARVGVRAQVQHLLAYTTKKPPKLTIVDPRYDLVKKSANFAGSRTWTSLNGKWAVPGTTYGQKILSIHQKILLEK